ncbi:MAG: iron-containing alcohol dehydrogenase [Polyangia bacterium]
MQFTLRTAGQMIFGRGEVRRAPELVAGLGRRVLLVTGGSSLERSGQLARLQDGLAERGLQPVRWKVEHEPDVAQVDAAAALCREAGCDVVLAVGGGSVLDVGKAAAALAQNPGSVLDYLEDIGRGPPRALTRAPLPVVAAPTTSGSGSESTRNSVVRVPELAVKRSMRGDALLPRVALVDPDLSAGAPLPVQAAAGLDALTHLIEGYVSRGAQPTTDALALRGLGLAARALTAIAERAKGRGGPGADAAAEGDVDGDDDVHAAMALASLWGGIVLANAGLGAVHGLVAPLGGQCQVAHGDGCACLLPATLVTNVRALRERAPGHPALPRYREIIELLCRDDATALEQGAERAAERLDTLRRDLGVRSLSAQGVSSAHLGPIIAQSRGGSMKFNPIELHDRELEKILEAALAAS